MLKSVLEHELDWSSDQILWSLKIWSTKHTVQVHIFLWTFTPWCLLLYIWEVNIIIQNYEHKHAFTFVMINATVKSYKNLRKIRLLCYVQVFFNAVLTTIHVYTVPKFTYWVSNIFSKNLTLSSSHLIIGVLIDWRYFTERGSVRCWELHLPRLQQV